MPSKKFSKKISKKSKNIPKKSQKNPKKFQKMSQKIHKLKISNFPGLHRINHIICQNMGPLPPPPLRQSCFNETSDLVFGRAELIYCRLLQII
jgi:hypothetical protein